MSQTDGAADDQRQAGRGRAVETRRRLLEAAQSVLEGSGLAAVSARSVTGLAETSVSAMNYGFGDRAGLLWETFAAIARQSLDWWRRQGERRPRPGDVRASAAWLTATVHAACHDPAYPRLAVQEMIKAGARQERFRPLATDYVRGLETCWNAFAGDLALPPGAGRLICAYATGLVDLQTPARDWTIDLAHIGDSAQRLFARLQGQREALPGWDGWAALKQAALEEEELLRVASSVAGRMLAAAADIIGRGGLQALTHRAVAQAAGGTLANVAYHFPSKDALTRGAFAYVFRQVIASGAWTALEIQQKAASAEFLAQDGVAVVLDESGAPLAGVMAIWELNLAASRDPTLQGLAKRLTAEAEATILRSLNTLDSLDAPLDMLDAHVSLAITTGSLRLTLAAEPACRRTDLYARSLSQVRLLFAN